MSVIPSVTTTDLPLSVFQVSKDYRRLQHVDANGYIVYPRQRGLVARSRTVNILTGTGAVAVTPRQLVEGIVRLTDPLTTSVTLPSAQNIVRYLQRLYGLDPRITPASFEWSAEVFFENRTAAPITLTGTAGTVLLPNGLPSDTIGIGITALELFVNAAGTASSVRFAAVYGASASAFPPRSAFTAIVAPVQNVDETLIWDASDSYNPYRATRTEIIRNSTVAGSTFLTTRSTVATTNSVGTNNTAVGTGAGAVLTSGSGNTLVGALAGNALTTGTLNTYLGQNVASSATTGTQNIGIGSAPLNSLTTGSQNVAIGGNALANGVTTSANLAMGTDAGRWITSGSNNAFFGTNAGLGAGVGYTVNDTTFIGNNAWNGPAGNPISNSVYWNTNLTAGAATVALQYTAATGNMFPDISSETHKKDFADSQVPVEAIDALIPRSFKYRTPRFNKDGELEYYEKEGDGIQVDGFVADEVARVHPKLVAWGSVTAYDEATGKSRAIPGYEHAPIGISNHALEALYAKCIIDLRKTVKELSERIAVLEAK